MDKLNRRTFLTTAGAGVGYSLVVQAGEFPSPGKTRTTEEIRAALEAVAPEVSAEALLGAEPHMRVVDLSCDLFVAGGGMAGVCAALAAARNGAKVILAQDRSRLGGNASSEVRMHIVGADYSGQRAGWREGGLIEELRLEYIAQNPHCAWELWDLLLYDKIMSEPNITLLLDSAVYSARVHEGRIQQASVRSDKTEHIYRITAHVYADCTGDCRLGLEAGARMRTGHESRADLGESLAPETAGEETLGSSILFTSKDHGRPMPYIAPHWARKITPGQLQFRRINSWEYGYWWIEWGGQHNAIWDNERIRFELLGIVLGVWDFIKNSGHHPDSATWALDWVGMLPGKRASRRLNGPHLLTQQDCEGLNGSFADEVAIGGWPFDDHPPGGFDDPGLRPAQQIKMPEVFGIPLRCLYSANVDNLFMAGRNISASHVAFTSTRVMATCSVIGQAMGTAAAQCALDHNLPRDLVADAALVRKLRLQLLRDDQTLKGKEERDEENLALLATLKSSPVHDGTRAEMVVDGYTRNIPPPSPTESQIPADEPGPWTLHQWRGALDHGDAWIELQWETPVAASQVQLCFDSGFERPLSLTEQLSFRNKMAMGPQPELVRDYKVEVKEAGGPWQEIAQVAGNFLRLRRHAFEKRMLHGLRILVSATNGAPEARIFDVRVY